MRTMIGSFILLFGSWWSTSAVFGQSVPENSSVEAEIRAVMAERTRASAASRTQQRSRSGTRFSYQRLDRRHPRQGSGEARRPHGAGFRATRLGRRPGRSQGPLARKSPSTFEHPGTQALRNRCACLRRYRDGNVQVLLAWNF